MAPTGEPSPGFPGTDCGNGNTQFHRDHLEWDVVLQSPIAEGGREAGADIAAELRLLSHDNSLHELHIASNGLNHAHAGWIIVVVELATAGAVA